MSLSVFYRKSITACFLLCLLPTILLSQQNFPAESFSRVHYYKLKAGFEKPNAENGIVLHKDEVESLLKIINSPASYEKTPEFRCFEPLDIFVFYNEQAERVGKIEFSSKCRKLGADRSIPAVAAKNAGLTLDAGKELQDLVFGLSKNLIPYIPEEVTQTTHVVKAGETWDLIAQTYRTTPELIAAMNKKSLAWAPEEGELLSVCEDLNYFPYPPLSRIQPAKVATKSLSPALVALPPTTTEKPVLKPLPQRPSAGPTRSNLSQPPPTTPPYHSTAPPQALEAQNTAYAEKPENSTTAAVGIQIGEIRDLPASPSPQESRPIRPSGLPTRTHVVKPQESLYKISQLYEVSMQEIMTANKLSNTSLAVGQKLVIPR